MSGIVAYETHAAELGLTSEGTLFRLQAAAQATIYHISYNLRHSGPRYRTRYNDWLRAGRSGDRIPVGKRFYAPVQTGPGGTQSPVKWVPSFSQG
jgi:hypothetical protein